MADIEYFYSAHSAFAYLGSARLSELARDSGRRIVHRPIDLPAVMHAAGSTTFKQRSDAHRQYFFHREIMRWSEHRKAPVFGRPSHHDNDVTLANCMLVAGVLAGHNIDALAHALLEAHWRFDADLADSSTLERVGNEAGYDARSLLSAASTASSRDAYEASTRRAIEQAVPGSPAYLVDGDLFYGQDRLEMVERAIHEPYSREWSGPQS